MEPELLTLSRRKVSKWANGGFVNPDQIQPDQKIHQTTKEEVAQMEVDANSSADANSNADANSSASLSASLSPPPVSQLPNVLQTRRLFDSDANAAKVTHDHTHHSPLACGGGGGSALTHFPCWQLPDGVSSRRSDRHASSIL